MNITKEKIEYFQDNIVEADFINNEGGTGLPDLFTLFLVLDILKPKVVVESGVWNGVCTKVIRKTLPDATIFCLDPRDVPSYGFKDDSSNTIYYTGSDFKDFEKLDLSGYNSNEILCFFSCNTNGLARLLQCISKKVIHILFNNNYPVNCGSYYTLDHFIKHDNRLYTPELVLGIAKTVQIKKMIRSYNVLPNIYPSSIKTDEGLFKCISYFHAYDEQYPLFNQERQKYRWNTYVELIN